jgi:excisionase family DNA binding protein
VSRPSPSPETPPARRWASRAHAAAYAGISERTLDDLINKGELRAYRLGPKMIRIDLGDLDALMVPLDGPAGRLPVRPTVRTFRDGTVRDTRARMNTDDGAAGQRAP